MFEEGGEQECAARLHPGKNLDLSTSTRLDDRAPCFDVYLDVLRRHKCILGARETRLMANLMFSPNRFFGLEIIGTEVNEGHADDTSENFLREIDR